MGSNFYLSTAFNSKLLSGKHLFDKFNEQNLIKLVVSNILKSDQNDFLYIHIYKETFSLYIFQNDFLYIHIYKETFSLYIFQTV